MFPKVSIQEERVEVSLELSIHYCTFSSQLNSSKVYSKALPAETGDRWLSETEHKSQSEHTSWV